METENNTMKYCTFKNNMGNILGVYISIATLNKLKSGTYKYPYVEITDGDVTRIISIKEIFPMFICNVDTISRDELEDRIRDGITCGRYVLIDEENGW